jgi:CheY-like chemotaxis protein
MSYKPTILVIEGDASVARLIAFILSDFNCDIDTFCEGPAAIAAIRSNKHYDLILTSHRVPGTDGIELIRAIRLLEHRKQTPIVLVTGSSIGLEQKARAAGADDVLRKPFDVDSFVAAVERHLPGLMQKSQ